MQFYEEITLQKIDFDWIEKCTQVKFLKKAIKLIEYDGDYYPQLKKACQQRIFVLDPSQKQKQYDQKKNNQQRYFYLKKKQIQNEIFEWQKKIIQQQQKQQKKVNYIKENPFKIISQQQISQEKKKKLAEIQKNKGNQALRSKVYLFYQDLDQAIQYYSKSISYDPTLSASYCNRALVYLKKKNIIKLFKIVIMQLNQIQIIQRHIQEEGRLIYKQVFFLQKEKYIEACIDFKQAIKIQPQNKQANQELKLCRQKMSQLKIDEQKQFKKIQIVQQQQQQL